MSDIEHTIHKPLKSKGVLIYGIHQGENPKLLADFVKQTGVTFPIVANQGFASFSFPPGTGYPYPQDVVIDKNLKVRTIKQSFNQDELKQLVLKLLAE